MAQIEQKRISHLIPLTDEEVNGLIKSTEKSSKWAMAVDYTIPDSAEAGQADQGTKHITVDRVGLLTERRTVPQSMLPHKMDIILDGTMARSGSGSPEKWTFTVTDTGDKYVCPGPPGEGELRPSIDTIYRDVSDPDQDGNNIYTQYRYVPDDNADVGTDDETGSFVPIPSDLVMVNGQGTIVTDNILAYTRQVDITIGTPCAAPSGNEDSLLIDNNGRLVHALSGVNPGTYPASEPSSMDFGDSFTIASFKVNKTGHITEATPHTMYVPKTAASTSKAGLVKIGTDIQKIGSACSAGTTTPNPYVTVAAADHVHAAYKLTFTNINDGSSAQTLVYDAATADKSYDFKNILHTYLPSAGPTAAYQFLVSSDGTSNARAMWANPTDVIHPDYVMVDLTSASYGTSLTGVSMNTSSKVTGGAMDVSSTSFSGLKEGKAYVVSYHFAFSHSTARTMLEDVVVELDTGSSSTPTTSATTATYVLDGSITGVPNFVNGSIVFVVPSGHSYARLALKTGGSSWTVTGNIQIAEVK
jgi:hypothetical protein